MYMYTYLLAVLQYFVNNISLFFITEFFIH